MGTSRVKMAAVNSSVSVMFSIFNMLIHFFIRRIFLENIGIEILGYNSVFSNILSMLNLTELGVGIVISYSLYEPVANHDFHKINVLIHVYRSFYIKIGMMILAAGAAIIPLLPILVKTDYSKLSYLAVIYLIQLLATVSSYFYSYRRAVFIAYQKNYVNNLADMVMCFGMYGIQIYALIGLNNYYIYIGATSLQVICSNALINTCCRKEYPFTKEKPAKQEIKRYSQNLSRDIKNVLVAKLGGYILNSTDSIVLSVILGSTVSGLVANYATIFISFQNLLSSAISTVQPSLGNQISSEGDKQQIEKTICRITFAVHLVVSVFSIGAVFLIRDFIILWISDKFLMSYELGILYSLNVYIFAMMYPVSLLFGALGYFRYDKWIILFAAGLNIVLSIVLVAGIGYEGVLIGTTIALLIYWIARTYILYKKYYKSHIWNYLIILGRCLAANVIAVAVLKFLFFSITFTSGLLGFVLKGICAAGIISIVNFIIFLRSGEFQFFYTFLKAYLSKKGEKR